MNHFDFDFRDDVFQHQNSAFPVLVDRTSAGGYGYVPMAVEGVVAMCLWLWRVVVPRLCLARDAFTCKTIVLC